jgi:hypothetical protein
MRLGKMFWIPVFVFFVLLAAIAEYAAAVRSSEPNTESPSTGDARGLNDGTAGDNYGVGWTPPHYIQ